MRNLLRRSLHLSVAFGPLQQINCYAGRNPLAHNPLKCKGRPGVHITALQVLAGRIERALQKGLALDELSADKRSLPPDMRWAAMSAIMSGNGCLHTSFTATRHEGGLLWQGLLVVIWRFLLAASNLQRPILGHMQLFMTSVAVGQLMVPRQLLFITFGNIMGPPQAAASRLPPTQSSRGGTKQHIKA